MLTDLFMNTPSILYAQFIQEKVNELNIRVVVTAEYSDEIENESMRQVRELVGRDIKVHFNLVSEIPRNPQSGKYREVISRISPP